MSDHGWKQFERRVSRDHGVERQPVTGERGAGDSMPHPLFAFQMKLRKAIPKCIRAWSDSIHRTATRDGKIGVLIVKEPGKQDDNALVVLRYRDWLDLHGSTKAEVGAPAAAVVASEARRFSPDGGYDAHQVAAPLVTCGTCGRAVYATASPLGAYTCVACRP